ncbi:hypothetical protein ACWCOV_35250 [Kribbella sp. NPDC002412]
MADEAEEIFQQTLNEVRRLINNLKLLKEALGRRQRARAALEFMRNARQQNPVLDRHLNENPDRAEQWGQHEREVRRLEEENARLAAENAERRAERDRLQEEVDRQTEANDDRDHDLQPDEIEDRHQAVDDAQQREEEAEVDERQGDRDGDGGLDRVEDEQEAQAQQARDDETDRQREAREEREREGDQRRRDREGQAVDPTAPVAAAGTAAVVADELNDREQQAQQDNREPELAQEAQQARDGREPELDPEAQQVRDGREPELDQEAQQGRDGREPELDGRAAEVGEQGERPQRLQEGVQGQQGLDYRDVMQEDGSISNATFTVNGPDQGQDGPAQPQGDRDGANVQNVGSGEVWIDGQQYHPVEQTLEGQRAERAAQQGERGPGRDVPEDERQRNQAVSFSGRAPADGAPTRPDPATLEGGRGGQTAAQVHAGASRGPATRTDGPGHER